MLELKKTPEHTIDRVFLLALLALFAATAFLVVSIGAKQYHSIADSMTANYETRTVSSYLEEKMNQNDVAGSVAVTSIGAFPAIALSEAVNDTIYTTYIYCYDGYLPEETLSSIYPESMSLDATILIYYDRDFLACGKQNAVYRATVDFLPDQLATIHITFLDTSTAETLYELSASCYQPISLSTTGGMQYE